jgi:hypothetical protein
MLTTEQREREERRLRAIVDSYSIEDQLARGKLTEAEAEAAKRRLVGIVAADVFSDGAAYEQLAEGGRVTLAGPSEEALAAAAGHYSEVHSLLKQPLSRDDLMNASQGYEGVSSLAAQRSQNSAIRKMEHQRDTEALQYGRMSQEQFDERAQEREREEGRARGENFSSPEIVDATDYIEASKQQDADRHWIEQGARHEHGRVR